MKNWIYMLLGAWLTLIMTACGGGSGGSSSRNTVVNANTCQAGYVLTSQYGCLPQSSCPAGYGMYQNSCIQGTINNNSCQTGYVYSSQYGCLPQAHCPANSGLYNNQCVYADQYNNSGYWGNNGGYIPYYPNQPQYQWGWQYQQQCTWWFGQLICQ